MFSLPSFFFCIYEELTLLILILCLCFGSIMLDKCGRYKCAGCASEWFKQSVEAQSGCDSSITYGGSPSSRQADFSSPYRNTSKTKQLTPSPAQIQSSHASFNLSSNTKDTLAHSTQDQYQEKFDFNNHNNVKWLGWALTAPGRITGSNMHSLYHTSITNAAISSAKIVNPEITYTSCSSLTMSV